jgi:molybdate/tungstate transport system substrate-binding protein
MPLRPALLAFTFAFILDPTGAAAEESCAPGAPRLVIQHAGSLSAAFKVVEKVFTERTGTCVVDVAGGSVATARNVTTGHEPCDIYASADYEVIDRMLKPAGHAGFTIRFAQGAMVLAYRTTSAGADAIAAPGAFEPPGHVPRAADDWYRVLLRPGVTVAGSHPFLDPGGYRTDLVFQLADALYKEPNLYSALLNHYAIAKRNDALGRTFDYSFTYEHSARAAAKNDDAKTYRYVVLPREVSLGDAGTSYAAAGIVVPGLALGSAPVRISASRVTWGLTIMNDAPNPAAAAAFLALLFSPDGVALQRAVGPEPITPPVASAADIPKMPPSLRSIVKELP